MPIWGQYFRPAIGLNQVKIYPFFFKFANSVEKNHPFFLISQTCEVWKSSPWNCERRCVHIYLPSGGTGHGVMLRPRMMIDPSQCRCNVFKFPPPQIPPPGNLKTFSNSLPELKTFLNSWEGIWKSFPDSSPHFQIHPSTAQGKVMWGHTKVRVEEKIEVSSRSPCDPGPKFDAISTIIRSYARLPSALTEDMQYPSHISCC